MVPELLNDWAGRVLTGHINVRLVSKKLHYEKAVYNQDVKSDSVVIITTVPRLHLHS